jgi:hypothetical protein
MWYVSAVTSHLERTGSLGIGGAGVGVRVSEIGCSDRWALRMISRLGNVRPAEHVFGGYWDGGAV